MDVILIPGFWLTGDSWAPVTRALEAGVVDARPDRVAKVVYVDSGPLADGGVINDALPVEGDSIPLPDPCVFEAAELEGLEGEQWHLLAGIAVPEPKGVATEQQRLSDERRYDVPAVVITSTMPEPLLRQFMEGGHPYVAELANARSVRILELPTGHWPQLTKPDELAAAIVDAVAA